MLWWEAKYVDRSFGRVDVGLLAATLIAIETALYSVAVALYAFLQQRSRLSFTDRVLLSALTKKEQMPEVASGITDKTFGSALLILLTVSYMFGLVAALVGWGLDDVLWIGLGLSAFLGAYLAALITIEWTMPRQVRKLVQYGDEFLALHEATEKKPLEPRPPTS